MARNTVLIAGCSSGIGEVPARMFAARGWNVVAAARNPYSLGDWSRMANVLALRLDVTDETAIGAAVAAGVARFGTIDVLVNHVLPRNATAIGTIVTVSSLSECAIEEMPHGVRVKLVELAQAPGQAPDPAEVAEAIFRAATDPSGRLRYRVGGGLLLTMRSLLPDAIWRRMLGVPAHRTVNPA